jgi:tetratricopeptide (TPR) repeat protein
VNSAAVDDPRDVRTWPLWDRLRPHVAHVVTLADQEGIAEPTNRLMNDLAVFLLDKGLYSEAEPLMRRTLAIGEATFGSVHSEVAIYLNNLAALLQATDHMEEAEPLMRRALAIDQAFLGSNHPNISIRLNNLAMLLQDTNRPKEAELLMRRALAIDEASFGNDHPNVARGLNSLAQLLRSMNRLKEAEPLMQRALAIDQASFGKQHPSVAIRLNNLALLLQDTKRLEEAEPLMRRALAIDKAVFDSEHPTLAIRLSNLARLLQDMNRLSEAEPMMRRALDIREKRLGPDHPKTRSARENLETLLTKMVPAARLPGDISRSAADLKRSSGSSHSKENRMKDFFISFNSADRSWADWVAWVLEEAKFSVVYQPWDFRPGENFILKMQEAASEARKTVIVLSDQYLKAEYTQPEWAAAFAEDPRGDQRKLIPFRIEKCSPTGMLKPLIFADLVGLTPEEAKSVVLSAVSDERPKPNIEPSFPGKTLNTGQSAPSFPGTPAPMQQIRTTPNRTGGALAIWQEKLEFLRGQEAIAADAAQKFALKKQIEEAMEKISELAR